MEDSRESDAAVADSVSRRSILARASQVFMAGGVVAAYGTFAGFLARYLYPARSTPTSWLFVAEVKRFGRGDSLLFETPAGATVNVARQGSGAQAADFIALSSTCPHLGCQVHWEAANSQFFCPCHNGAFNVTGEAIAGPPAESGQSLSSYPLQVRGGLLFIEVPQAVVAMGEGRILERQARRGGGHDPCLARATRPDQSSRTVVARGSAVAEGAPVGTV